MKLLSALIFFSYFTSIYSQIIYSLVNWISDNSFQVKAKSKDGQPLSLTLNDYVLGSITPVANNGNYLYEKTFGISISLNRENKLEFVYNNQVDSTQTKYLNRKNFTSSDPYKIIIASHLKSPKELASSILASEKNPDSVLFFGDISNKYSSDMEEDKLVEIFDNSKFLKL